MTDEHNILQFSPPRGPLEVLADMGALRAVSEAEDEPYEGDDDLDMGDLFFIAKRLMRRIVNNLDWVELEDMALVMTDDESDAQTVVKLMENAVIDIYWEQAEAE